MRSRQGKFILLTVAILSVMMARSATGWHRIDKRKLPVWQESEAAFVQLGVRDKFGTLGSYQATFVVIGPNKGRWQKKIVVKNDNFGMVYFPDDFDTWEQPGTYNWKCLVHGKVVANGTFRYKSLEPNGDQLVVFH